MSGDQSVKNEIERLLKLPGEVRGQVFLTDFEYVRDKGGEEFKSLLKNKIKEWGVSLDYEEIKATEWYPLGLRVVSLLAIKDALSWGDKEIFELGNSAPKYSFIVKLLMKYFLSSQRTFKESPKYWEKHYTRGEIEPYEYSKEKKHFIIRLKNFKIHPILCVYFAGYFLRIGQYVQRNKEGSGRETRTIKETKCVFKGDHYDEFVIKWE
ncbi:MAG: hypothetical protein PHW72_00400 [Candidatus Pacebacteria bacterium]|nr:hypothetical protein [Candidatus Paceibacterota bacterium]